MRASPQRCCEDQAQPDARRVPSMRSRASIGRHAPDGPPSDGNRRAGLTRNVRNKLMSQANDSPTTTLAPATTPAAPSPRISFQSAGAVRRPSFPRPLTVRELAEDILKSHRHLIERLAAVPPNTVGATLE